MRWYHYILIALAVGVAAYLVYGLAGLLAAPAIAAAGAREFKTEILAIGEGRRAADLAAELGHHQTVLQLTNDHAETIKKLDKKEEALRLTLRDDPKRLAHMLVRAGRRRV